MMDGEKKSRHILSKLCAVVLCMMMILVWDVPLSTSAEGGSQRIVKVGCFPYEEQLKVDINGNYSGYGYDYLQEIARYTGWKYEFVNASWNACLNMLERGEIDLMGAVMRSPEREGRFDFSDNLMISGYGVLATPLTNQELPYEDFAAFDGLKVGVMKGNLQTEMFEAYGRSHNFTPILKEYNSQTEMDSALKSGEIDAVIMTSILRSSKLRVVATFGENDSYFATTKGNTSILEPLNDAMQQIRLKDPYFNSKLNQKYYDLQTLTAISFTREELDFIKNCPPISCVYIPDAIPISYYDKSSGKVQGIAVDVCQLLEERTGLKFKWINPASASEAADLLRRGDALLLPAKYYDFSWAEQNDVRLTDPYLQSQMVMVTGNRASSTEVVALYDQGSQSRLTADAVSRGAQMKQYATIIDCMDAVLHGEANTTFINSTIAYYLVNNPKYSGLQTTPLYGFSADVAMAVSSEADPLLVSVLNKGLRNISSTEMNQIILSQMQVGESSAMATYLYLHPLETVLLVVGISLALILVLLTLLYIRRKNDRKMWQTLYTDALTGHPNYRALSRDIVKLIDGHPEQHALIYLDIHRFKVINDTFGYDAGDQVLIAISNILRNFVGSGEQMARIHADTFVLLLQYTTHVKFRDRLNELSDQLEHLTFENSDGIKPLFRGGVYPLSKDFDNLDKACDRANYAKSSITHHFSNTFVFYDDVMHSQVLAEKELESSMSTALERGEFRPYYQPKVNAITGKVVGAEALIRWEHPEKGCLLPGEFLPFYEKNGFIVVIDLSIFEQVCQDMQRWIQAGNQAVSTSVNFSRRHIQDKELPQKLKRIADHYQIPTHLLEIEVTETEELESLDVAIDFVDSLKSFGFVVSIDDYGTGYSSISFLQQLPLDVLKLDRTFIMNAMKSEKAKDIMRYLVVSMQKNGIQILCEGIETMEQRDFVISLNCRFIQGYFYSTALLREDFEAYLLQHGIDTSDNLDFMPITNFEKDSWIGAEDFLTKSMPSWIFSCFVEQGYPTHYISPSFLDGLGYSELEFQTATSGYYANLVHPDDLAQVFQLLDQHRNSTYDLLLQYRLRKKDGIYIWIREINKRILTDDGREAILGVCTDVTDMVALQEEKSRIIETIPGGVGELLMTEDGPVIRQAAERFYEIIGYTPDEMEAVGNNLYNIIYKQDLPSAVNTLRQILEMDTPSCECTFRIQHSDATLHWVTFRGTISPVQEGLQATIIIFTSDEEVKARQDTEIVRAKLELALSLTGQAVFEYDMQTKIVYSHSGFSGFGIIDGIAIDSPEGMLKNGFIHPEDAPQIKEAGRKIAMGEERTSYEARVRSQQPDNPYYWVRVTLSTIFNEDRQPTQVVGVVEDINQQKRFEYAFQQEAQYRKAFTESSLMAYELNLSKDTIQRITGSRGFRLQEFGERMKNPDCYSELLAASTRFLVVPDDEEYFLRELSRERMMELYKDGIFEKELEYRRLTMDGDELWTSALTYLLLDQLSGDVMGYVYHRDINERKKLEEGLADQAARDPLTGVINRSTAETLIKDFLFQKMNPKRIQAFLMIDLDRFKAINDTYGHQTGDQYLVKLAHIITQQLREEDIIARMGGDEFAILLKNLPDEGVALSIAEKLAIAAIGIGEELKIALPTSISIGIAVTPLHGLDFETLYRNADEAMYRAKQKTDVRVLLYD